MATSKLSLNNLITAVLAVWIIIAVGSLGYSKWSDQVKKDTVQTHSVSKWRDLLVGRQPSLGSAAAPVAIVEFFDYQCPYCKVVEPRLEKLVSDHPGEIAVYRYDFPLAAIHPYAMPAAIAADCAAIQDTSGAYPAQLFKQATFIGFSWMDLAKKTGVRDIDGFSKCIDDRVPANSIAHDMAVGKTLNVTGTPALIFNGAMVSGALSDGQLAMLYKKARSANN